MSNLLDSEQVYVDLFATSGRWRIKRLPRIAAEEGYRQRAIHKSHKDGIDTCPCSGCVRRRNGFELSLDFASGYVHDATKPVHHTSMQNTSNEESKLAALREELERRKREPKPKKKK